MKNNEINLTEATSNQIRRTRDVPLRTNISPIPTQEDAKKIMTDLTQKIEHMRKVEKSLDKTVKNTI